MNIALNEIWVQVGVKFMESGTRGISARKKTEILSFEAINVSLLTEEKPFSALLISGSSPAATSHKSVHVSANGQITTEVVSIGLILKHHLCCQ